MGATAEVPVRLRDLTRWRLLKTSIRIFGDKGFNSTSTREITRTAGVSIALIWFHFGGKEGLYLEALRFSKRLAERAVAKLPRVPGPTGTSLEAETALRALSEMILRAAMPVPEGSVRDQGLGRATVAFVTREMARPRAGAEEALAGAIMPVAVYLRQCLKVLRPDLDGEALGWLALRVESLLLLPASHPALLSMSPSTSRSLIDPESLTSQILDVSLHEIRQPVSAIGSESLLQ